MEGRGLGDQEESVKSSLGETSWFPTNGLTQHYLHYIGHVIVEQVVLFGDYVKLTPSPSNTR